MERPSLTERLGARTTEGTGKARKATKYTEICHGQAKEREGSRDTAECSWMGCLFV